MVFLFADLAVLTRICVLCFFCFSVYQLKRSFPFMGFQMLHRSPAQTSLSSVQQSYSNWTFTLARKGSNTKQNQVFQRVCWKFFFSFVGKICGLVWNEIKILLLYCSESICTESLGLKKKNNQPNKNQFIFWKSFRVSIARTHLCLKSYAVLFMESTFYLVPAENFIKFGLVLNNVRFMLCTLDGTLHYLHSLFGS